MVVVVVVVLVKVVVDVEVLVVFVVVGGGMLVAVVFVQFPPTFLKVTLGDFVQVLYQYATSSYRHGSYPP